MLPVLKISHFSLSLAAALTVLCSTADAFTYKTLYAFKGGSDGAKPLAGVAVDAAGNVFGTTSQGGNTGCSHHLGCGTVFKIAPDGTETILTVFSARKNGRNPEAPPLIDPQGNLYGTTLHGSKRCSYPRESCGTVFKIGLDGAESVLHHFRGGFDDGALPRDAALIMDKSENLYGVTLDGGDDHGGVIFEITSAGRESLLFNFSISTNAPRGTLLRDGAGDLYGAADNAVFRLASDGSYTVLHQFNGTDGNDPDGGLIADKEGNLYGTTAIGGQNGFHCQEFGCGTIFKLAPDGRFTTLYAFDGAYAYGPYGSLVADKRGNLYGTANQIFELSEDGQLTLLGIEEPNPGLAMDTNGNLYGTTWAGGDSKSSKYGCGFVFELIP
ncbi:MAG TPA: choice-of-anchor tandem repeat GloVer-containing protein [Rhizomicrobium sp.]|jgi:uncharacterized repeat protein (TIGR03803 family)